MFSDSRRPRHNRSLSDHTISYYQSQCKHWSLRLRRGSCRRRSNPATAHRTQVAGSGKRRGSKSSSRLSEAAESSGNVNRFNSGLRDRSVSCCGTGAQLPQNLCSALLLRIGTKWVASRDSPSLRRSATTAVKIRSWSRAFRN